MRLLLLISLIAPIFYAEAATRDCDDFLDNGNFAPRRTGYYTFIKGRAYWVANDGSHIEPYYTASASHREILRRQVGEQRYQEIMSSKDPEAAAVQALMQPIPVSPLRLRMAEIPLEKRLSPEMVTNVLEVLRTAGIYAENLQEWLRLNAKEIPGLGRARVELKFVDVRLVISPEESLKLRLYKPLYEQDVDGRNYIYHIKIIEMAREFVSEGRLRFDLGYRAEAGSMGSIVLDPPRRGNPPGMLTVGNKVKPERGTWKIP